MISHRAGRGQAGARGTVTRDHPDRHMWARPAAAIGGIPGRVLWDRCAPAAPRPETSLCSLPPANSPCARCETDAAIIGKREGCVNAVPQPDPAFFGERHRIGRTRALAT